MSIAYHHIIYGIHIHRVYSESGHHIFFTLFTHDRHLPVVIFRLTLPIHNSRVDTDDGRGPGSRV